MDIEQFVAEALIQIDKGLKSATDQTENSYLIHTGNGIQFDLAVTSSSEDSSTTNKKAGVIKVVDAGIGKASSTTNKAETASRIQFTIYY